MKWKATEGITGPTGYLAADNGPCFVAEMPAVVGQVGKSKHIRNVLLGQTNVLLNPVFSHCLAVETLFSESMSPGHFCG